MYWAGFQISEAVLISTLHFGVGYDAGRAWTDIGFDLPISSSDDHLISINLTEKPTTRMLQLVFTRVSTRSLQRFLRPSTLRSNGATLRLPFSPIGKRFSSEIPTTKPKPVAQPELATTPVAVPRPRTWNLPRKWRYPTAGIAITTGLVAGYSLPKILNEETGSNKLFQPNKGTI